MGATTAQGLVSYAVSVEEWLSLGGVKGEQNRFRETKKGGPS